MDRLILQNGIIRFNDMRNPRASASLVTSSTAKPRHNARLSHDHGKATQFLKKEMLKAIAMNKEQDIQDVLSLAKEYGINEKEIYPHGYKK